MISRNKVERGARPSVLFMGRRDDESSISLLHFVEEIAGEVTVVWSDGRGASLSAEARQWRGDLMFCFRSHIIVPADMIGRAAIAAVNFHPGPPNYRGTGCVNFALYDGARAYGCTGHLLAPEIDAGDILDVRRFSINDEDDLAGVLQCTHGTMLTQAKDVVGRLVRDGKAGLEALRHASSGERWEGRVGTVGDLDALMLVDADMDADELARRTRATKIGAWAPFVMVGGKKFVLAD